MKIKKHLKTIVPSIAIISLCWLNLDLYQENKLLWDWIRYNYYINKDQDKYVLESPGYYVYFDSCRWIITDNEKYNPKLDTLTLVHSASYDSLYFMFRFQANSFVDSISCNVN